MKCNALVLHQIDDEVWQQTLDLLTTYYANLKVKCIIWDYIFRCSTPNLIAMCGLEIVYNWHIVLTAALQHFHFADDNYLQIIYNWHTVLAAPLQHFHFADDNYSINSGQ